MDKKGDLSWDYIGKIVLALLVLLLIFALIGQFSSKGTSVFESIKSLFSFSR